MRKSFILVIMLITFCDGYCQGIGIGTTNPNNSSIIEISSNSKGILIPRMSSNDKTSISNPAVGLLIYQTDMDTGFHYFDGLVWKSLLKSNNNTTTNGNTTILYRKRLPAPFNRNELWAINIDGSNRRKVNITLPANMEFEWEEMARVTSDGRNIILLLRNSQTNQQSLYKCDIDGNNLSKIIDEDIDVDLAIQSIY